MAAWGTTTLQHQFIHVNGIRLHYVTQGRGPLLLFLHGFPECWYTWRHQIPVFAECFTVVAVDLRGYNDSDKPPAVSDYAMPKLVKDISALITALGFATCHLVGHDWGGGVAWSFAYAHPERVDRLAILNYPHPRRFLEGFANPRQWWRSAYMGFFQLPWLPELVLSANNYQFIDDALTNMAVNRSAITPADVQTFKAAIARPGALSAALNYYRNLLSANLLQAEWPILEVPTLMIWGEADPAFESSLAEGTEAYVRDFRLRYIRHCGHWVPQEYPDLVNQYLAEFFAVTLAGDKLKEV